MSTTEIAVGAFLDVMSAVALAIARFGALDFVALKGMHLLARACLTLLMPASAATYLFIDQHVPDDRPVVAGIILTPTLTTIVVLPIALVCWSDASPRRRRINR